MDKIQYPEENCHKVVIDFVDTLNKVLEPIKAVVIDKYYLSQNATHNCIYKIMVSPYDCLTCEVFMAEENIFRYEDFTSKIKHVKYDSNYQPADAKIYLEFSEENLKAILKDLALI